MTHLPSWSRCCFNDDMVFVGEPADGWMQGGAQTMLLLLSRWGKLKSRHPGGLRVSPATATADRDRRGLQEGRGRGGQGPSGRLPRLDSERGDSLSFGC